MAFGINFVSGLVINCVVALGERLSSLGGTLVHDLWQTDVELDKKQNGGSPHGFPHFNDEIFTIFINWVWRVSDSNRSP